VVTYGHILNAKPVLITIIGTKLPARLSLKFARAVQQIFLALDVLEAEKRKLGKDYIEADEGTQSGLKLDEDNNPVWKDEDSREGFERDYEALLETEVEGLDYAPIKMNHWPKSYELEPKEALALFECGLLTD
jgi:hypothetical protein